MNPSPKHGCTHCYGAREVTQPAYTGTFMGRSFPIGAKQVACPSCSVVVVRGVRTHQTTALQTIVLLTFECRYRDNVPMISITEGGVTGHESVYFDERFYATREKGWWACVGTPGRYDSLFVPAKEMRSLFERLGLS
jgi:hypothetical protein